MAGVSDRYFDLNFIGERSMEENWKFFHKQYLQLIEEHVPKKTLSTKSYLPWMSTTLKQLLKKQRIYIIVLRNTSVRKIGMNTKV